ncbi:MAG TPA: hypothetical protein PLV42_10625 [bacterium]|nr:hypothetical protein [bacterium]
MPDDIIIDMDGNDQGAAMIAILQKLGETEEAVAALYRAYAEVWPADGAFWRTLAKTEDGHRAYIGHVIVMVRERPDDFRPVHFFSVEMLDTFIKKIQGHAVMARAGQLNEKQALYEAHQIENMALESELALLFKSGNAEFLRFSATILSEEKEHRDAIHRLIQERYPK